MTSSRPAATEGKASGGGERVRHRGLFGATKNLAILLVAVSSSVLIVILDAIVVTILVVMLFFYFVQLHRRKRVKYLLSGKLEGLRIWLQRYLTLLHLHGEIKLEILSLITQHIDANTSVAYCNRLKLMLLKITGPQQLLLRN